MSVWTRSGGSLVIGIDHFCCCSVGVAWNGWVGRGLCEMGYGLDFALGCWEWLLLKVGSGVADVGDGMGV